MVFGNFMVNAWQHYHTRIAKDGRFLAMVENRREGRKLGLYLELAGGYGFLRSRHRATSILSTKRQSR